MYRLFNKLKGAYTLVTTFSCKIIRKKLYCVRNYIVKDITIIIIEDVPKKLLYNKNFHAFVVSEAERTLHNLGDIFPTFDWWVFIWAIKTWNLCFPVRVIKERHRTSWSASLEFFFWNNDSVNLSSDKLVSDFIGFSCRIICTWFLQSW